MNANPNTTPNLPAFLPAAAGGIQLSERGAVQLRNMAEAAGFAQLLQAGGMLPAKMTPTGAVVAILAGANVGLNPFEAVQNIAVIGGRPALFGDGMKAVVRASGLLESEKVEWVEKDGQRVGCRVHVKRKGEAEPITGEFTVNQAKRAGLWGKSGPWTDYPARMLLARARAFAFRDAFPDVLKGLRSAEEERDTIEAEVVAAAPVPAAAALPPPPPQPQALPPPSPAKRRTRAQASELLAAPVASGVAAGASEAVPPTSAAPSPMPAPVAKQGAETEALDFL